MNRRMFLAALAATGAGPASALAAKGKPSPRSVFGKIQFVESFPDVKVEVVDAFADLDVQIVDSFPDRPGRWQIVDAFPDFKVQVVSSFADFKIRFVTAFPGPARSGSQKS